MDERVIVNNPNLVKVLKVSIKGQVTIPFNVRSALGVDVLGELGLYHENGEYKLKPLEKSFTEQVNRYADSLKAQGGLVFVTGSPKVGKTMLIRDMLIRFRQTGSIIAIVDGTTELFYATSSDDVDNPLGDYFYDALPESSHYEEMFIERVTDEVDGADVIVISADYHRLVGEDSIIKLFDDLEKILIDNPNKLVIVEQVISSVSSEVYEQFVIADRYYNFKVSPDVRELSKMGKETVEVEYTNETGSTTRIDGFEWVYEPKRVIKSF